MKICSRCGAPVKQGNRVCPNCGNKINAELGNTTKALFAAMFFALGLCLVALYSLYIKNNPQEETAAAMGQTILGTQAEEGDDAVSDVPEVDILPDAEDEAEPSGGEAAQMQHTDLSGYVGELPDQLVAATGAIEMGTSGDLAEYHTENDAVIISETEDGYTVLIGSENIYSLYGLYVGMSYEEAVSLMEDKGYPYEGNAFSVSEEISLQVSEADGAVSAITLTYTAGETE